MNGSAAQQMPEQSVPGGAAEAQPPVPAERPKRKARKLSAMQMLAQGEPVSDNIMLCADGKYRWVYRMNLLKNPTVFLLIWKIFFFIIIGIFAVTTLADLIRWGAAQILESLKFFGWFLLGMTALVAVSCLVCAAFMGGSYTVMFEMDERGVNHKQLPWQAKKAQDLSDLTVLAGLAAGNLTTVGIGMNAARTEMYSAFDSVRKVIAFPRRGLIKVNGRLCRNQVYAAPEDFDFVLEYIRSHCENLK